MEIGRDAVNIGSTRIFYGSLTMRGIVLILLFFLHQQNGVASESCPIPAEIGSPYTLSLDINSLNESFVWTVNSTVYGDMQLSCNLTGSCSFDDYFYRWWMFRGSLESSGNGSYTATITINTIGSLEEDAMSVRWFDEETFLGECYVQVYSFEHQPNCSVLELNGSTQKWNCSVSEVYPEILCLVEYENAIHQNDSSTTLPSLLGESSSELSKTKRGYFDSVCTVETPVTSLDTGTYRFKMTLYPNVTDGLSLARSHWSDQFIVVKNIHTKMEDSDGIGNGAIAGITVAVAIFFSIVCFVMGLLVGKRRCRSKEQPNERMEASETVVSNNKDDGLTMDALQTPAKQKDQTKTNPNINENTPSVARSPKHHQQNQGVYSEAASVTNGTYANQSEMTFQMSNFDEPNPGDSEDIYEQPPPIIGSHFTKTKSNDDQKYDYDHPKSNIKPNKPNTKIMAIVPPKTIHDQNATRGETDHDYLTVMNDTNISSRNDNNKNGLVEDTEDNVYEMTLSSKGSNLPDDDDRYLYINPSKPIPLTASEKTGTTPEMTSNPDEPEMASTENSFQDVYEGIDNCEIKMDDIYLNSDQAIEYYNA